MARAVGLIDDKYFSIKGDLLRSQVGVNLIKTKKVAFALEELVREGVLVRIANGKIYYRDTTVTGQKKVTRKEIAEAILNQLLKIKGYGAIDAAEAGKKMQCDSVWEILAPEGSRSGFIQKTGDFLGTWGLYSLFLDRLSINMAAGRILYEHKISEARTAGERNALTRADEIRHLAEKEVREKGLEEIKQELQADNPEELEPITLERGEVLPRYAFVISDVHLREYHHENTDELLRFIWMVLRLNGRLIINGDFFDVWRAGGLDRAWTNNTRVVNALTKLKEVILVAGNHDEFLATLARRGGIFANPNLKVLDEYVSSDKRIRIFHGHQFDRFNRPGSWIGRWATRALTRLEMSRLRKMLEALNRRTAGAFTLFSRFLGFLTGPKLSARLLLLLKFFVPTSYNLNRQVRNIMEWIAAELDLARKMDDLKLSRDEPIVFIIGHLHYEGISFLNERVRAAVEKEYGGKVRLIITDSWEGGEGYASDFVAITDPAERPGELIVRKEIWKKQADWRD